MARGLCMPARALQSACAAVYPEAIVAPSLFVANSDSRWFWGLATQIFRFNPIKIHADDVGMFHGIDERISVTNYVDAALLMRRFIVDTDARSCPGPQVNA